MKAIVGLGNPGAQYQNTRHNIGQRFIDKVARTRSEIATPAERDSRLRVASGDVKLHKTNIFMNESGKEVKKLATDYRLPTTDLLIVHDDVDLPPGGWKLQFNRSSAGHKGVQSIIDALGTQEFWRLRIGVGKPPARKTANDFVVEKPTKEEQKLIDQAINEASLRVSEWVAKNL